MNPNNQVSTPALQAASRANGMQGGRKRKMSGKEALIRQRATELGRSALHDVVQFWVFLVRNQIEGAELGDRMRAAENLADRFGLPRKTEHEALGDGLTPKTFYFIQNLMEAPKTNGHAVVVEAPEITIELPPSSANGHKPDAEAEPTA